MILVMCSTCKNKIEKDVWFYVADIKKMMHTALIKGGDESVLIEQILPAPPVIHDQNRFCSVECLISAIKGVFP